MKDSAAIRDIKRILILRTDGIGDVLNSTPAISALHDVYRDAHISVVVRPPGAEILFLNPHIDEVLVYDVSEKPRRHGDTEKETKSKELRAKGKEQRARGKEPRAKDSKLCASVPLWFSHTVAKLRFLRQLRAGRYDMAVVLHNSSQCNFMAYLSGAQYRTGRKSERKCFSFTLTHGVSSTDPKGTKHEIDRNMDVVRLIGACGGGIHELTLCLSEGERAWAQDFLCRQGIVERAASSLQTSRRQALLVGIHPGGSSFDKLWPAENFAQVANRLMQEFEARIILFSGPGEDDLVQGIRKLMERPPISAAGLRLRQLAALIEKCSLFFCNDSGPMHIAAALKVPTVAIFGPTDHVRWKPRNEKTMIVRRNMDCWPCSAHKCKRGFECIKSLSVGEVLDAGYSILDA